GTAGQGLERPGGSGDPWRARQRGTCGLPVMLVPQGRPISGRLSGRRPLVLSGRTGTGWRPGVGRRRGTSVRLDTVRRPVFRGRRVAGRRFVAGARPVARRLAVTWRVTV